MDIFVQGVDGTSASVWDTINQTIRWDGEGADFATPAAFTTIRFQVDSTANQTGAHFHLNEFEIFGEVVPEPTSTTLLSLAGLGIALRRRR